MLASLYASHICRRGWKEQASRRTTYFGQSHRCRGVAQEEDEARTPEDLSPQELEGLLFSEVTRVNEARPDREAWETITAVAVAAEPFSVEAGTLTQTMKLRREVVCEKHAAELDALLARLR